ncbi:MAG: formate--tetrahydrofolate ligase [Nitrospira sp.]|nr:formate--tetrahydrofolate ligase [Nitrospira sp.]MBP0121260.1 formate--tetrahydrofolate ligase [Nitrospira sp.]MBP0124753.1 formate--tetrahydrofolate ligase [Nitrospira sp.]MBP0126971.1 formate--tetrahydrofolate ligase [Nitrospira sp.]MBP0130133.1 formate--tetrahydrofolate ligase [Nitrospira sp.]
MTDIEINRSVKAQPIQAVADQLGILASELLPYGRLKAKVSLDVLERLKSARLGRYVLVTAINPTPLGEGKTTTSIGLAMGLSRLGHRTAVTLRQPSLGPVFGIKGGGTGGGRAQVLPMEEINLHLTGDAHAVSASHNLLSAFVDNHIFHGNELRIDLNRITWPRTLGISDRSLRQVLLGEGTDGRRGQFVITEASEVMAMLALASSQADLRCRLGQIIVGFTTSGKAVRAEELGCAGSMAVLLRDALLPNLVQTLEGTPAFVHTGPFGNIAHGNCSIISDAIALRCADYVVTEAGFGSDLGAEKFFNIKCRLSGFKPAVAVVVVTLRALKLHGGGGTVKVGTPLPAGLTGPNREALAKGFANLEQHIANVKAHGVPVVVAVNAFRDDPVAELEWVRERSREAGAVDAAVSTHWADGGKGAEALAQAVARATETSSSFRYLYEVAWPIKKKIQAIATEIYGASGVSFDAVAERDIESAEQLGLDELPICMAKTPLSLSHDPALKGRPTGFTLPIKEVRMLAGAGFLTAVCSGIQLMPGLPKKPAGERIDIDPATGEVVGLS